MTAPRQSPLFNSLTAGLYLVATPIGNLGDISDRARMVLESAGCIACEDSRMTAKLLRLLGIKSPPLIPYHDHNSDQAEAALLARLAQGQAVALVSDAGCPVISDPGHDLVKAVRAAGFSVTTVPGASAVISAIQLSGLPSDRFLFGGFLPAKEVARRQSLRELAAVPATLVFYESPNRLAESLADMALVLGERPAAVVREVTKLYEQVIEGSLSHLAGQMAAQPVKGEIVVVVGPPLMAEAVSGTALEDAVRAALDRGLGVKDAAALVSAETGHPRRTVYALAVSLSQGGRG